MGFGTGTARPSATTACRYPHDGKTQGHLEARGPCIASGYYRHEAKTSTGWLSTGDVARIHRDGTIEIVDRSKDVIKSAASGSAASPWSRRRWSIRRGAGGGRWRLGIRDGRNAHCCSLP